MLEHLEVNSGPVRSGDFIDSLIIRGCHSFLPQTRPLIVESDLVELGCPGQPSN